MKLFPATSRLPVIVCTADLREVREIEPYLRARGVIVLHKPFELDEFLAAVDQALQEGARVAVAAGYWLRRVRARSMMEYAPLGPRESDDRVKKISAYPARAAFMVAERAERDPAADIECPGRCGDHPALTGTPLAT